MLLTIVEVMDDGTEKFIKEEESPEVIEFYCILSFSDKFEGYEKYITIEEVVVDDSIYQYGDIFVTVSEEMEMYVHQHRVLISVGGNPICDLMTPDFSLEIPTKVRFKN